MQDSKSISHTVTATAGASSPAVLAGITGGKFKNCTVYVTVTGQQYYLNPYGQEQLIPAEEIAGFIAYSSTINTESRTLTYFWNLLRENYRQNNTVSQLIDAYNPMSIKEIFVQLQIISPSESQEAKQLIDLQIKSDDYIDSYESIYAAKQPINIEALFEPSLQSIAKSSKYLLDGRAGIGKSTLLQHIVYRWSFDAKHPQVLWEEQFDWVFLIPLRNISKNNIFDKDFDEVLISILEKECLKLGPGQKLTKYERKLFLQAIKHHKILLLLDGYDEFNLSKDFELEDFLEYLLNSSHYIITSRPYQFRITDKDCQHLEIMGFNLSAIEEYIDKKYEQTNKRELNKINPLRIRQLKKLIRENSNLQGIAHVPINLELLCSVWEKNEVTLEDFTITSLYREIVKCLNKRYQEKYHPKNKDNDLIHTFIKRLAFIGMEKHHILLEDEDIDTAMAFLEVEEEKKEQLLLQIKRMGFVKPLENNKYCFIHLSLQEYLAACYCKNVLNKKPNKITNFIRNNKYEPRYQVMWWFLAGELAYPSGVYEDALQIYFNILCDKPLTIPSIYQICLLARCLNEANFTESIKQTSDILTHFAKVLAIILAGKHNTSDASYRYYDGTSYHMTKWDPILLNVIYGCRRIMERQEVEKILIEAGNGKCFIFFHEEKLQLLVGLKLLKVCMQEYWQSGRLTINGSPVDDEYMTFLNELMKRYKIKCIDEVLTAIGSSTCYYTDHFRKLSAQFLCHSLSDNPGIIFFLQEISRCNVDKFKSKRAETIQNAANNLLSNIYICSTI